MIDDSDIKLTLQLTPAEGEPDPQLLDDLIRLVKQAILTSPQQIPSGGDFESPSESNGKPLLGLESKIKHHIEQASAASRTLVEQRVALAQQPDADAKLAEDSRQKAQQVISAVQRAMMRGINVTIPDSPV